MVNHNPEGHTGINYHHYRWYKDGQLVKEGPDADSYDEGGAILEGCYHLEVSTSASDDYWVSSNELCFGTLGIDGADSELGFTLAPNPVAQGAQVVLAVEADEALLQKATLRIFDASGRVVLESRNGLQPTIEATFARGTYLVQVILTDGRKATRKLVVK
ncbi:MAG: T9SS type A sorting domain-containing protein [Bacteroidales bacterium]|nr:T9SS type A sorting domain-containing protein [Bacteroidales bacterium]